MSELVRRRIQRPYVIRYVLALSLIAAFVLGGHVALDRLLASQDSSAAQINVAGRQRMLSQRVASAAGRLPALDVTARADARGRLADAVDRLEREHDALRDGDPALGLDGEPPPEVVALLDGPDGLDAALEVFVADARALLAVAQPDADDPRLARVLAAADGPLLAALDDRVTAYQEVADGQVSGLRDLTVALTAGTLLVLALEALLVFRPMGRRLTREARRLAEAEQHARALSEQDPLTGLPNRRHVSALVDRLSEQRRRVAVALGDVDHFKAVNDTHGHLVGDDVLVAVARALQEVCAEAGVCARFGGEEFLVLLPDVQARDLARVVEHVGTVLAARCASAGLPAVTLTWGVGEAAPGRWSEGLGRADRAVYAGKRAGRDRVVVLLDDDDAERAGHRGPVVASTGTTASRPPAPRLRAAGLPPVPAPRREDPGPGRPTWHAFATAVAQRRP